MQRNITDRFTLTDTHPDHSGAVALIDNRTGHAHEPGDVLLIDGKLWIVAEFMLEHAPGLAGRIGAAGRF